MHISVDFRKLVKMAGKLARHRVQQYLLTTNETRILSTNDGKVKGVKRKTIYDDSFYAFEGIPYAKPPTGELRFRAPQSVEPWEIVRDCTNFKNKPIQSHMLLPIIEGSEDCLYLNVYVKNLETSTPLPVIVWIHGGGFITGEASRDIYAPDYFMMHDVLLVSITYRLNAFGFLSLNDPDIGVPGNAGIKDQIMALRWVKSNIHHFNGDANNITLVGESAGAASTHILMTTPQTKNLFHRAVLMSGSGYCYWAIIPQKDKAFRLACALGYDGPNNDKQIFHFLTKSDAHKIINACNNLVSRQERREHFIGAFAPTIEPYDSEGAVTTKPFLEMFKNAWSHEIPLLIGGTSFEGLFFYRTAKQYPYVVNELDNCEVIIPHDAKIGKNEIEIENIGLKIKKMFFNNEQPNLEKHFYQYLDLTSYSGMWHGIYRTILARSAYARNTPTYLYRFDFDSPHFNHFRILSCGAKERGVSHADDMSYLFYNISASKQPIDSQEFKTIKRMTGMCVSFAKNADPNFENNEVIKWEPVQIDKKEDIKCLNISDNIEIIPLPEYKKLNAWNEFYSKDTLF